MIDRIRKLIAVAAAMITAVTLPFAVVTAEEKESIAVEESTEAKVASPETQPVQSAQPAASPQKSSVTVVHTAEIGDSDYEPTEWWKAGIEEYDDLSLLHYEKVVPVQAETKDAEFIAQGGDDSITEAAPAVSAVGSTEDGTFAFTTYGYGHGVGLSQNGANFYALYAGWNYQDILFHYYPGTSLMNTGTAETEIVTVQGKPGNVLQQVAEIVNCEVGPSFHEECIKAQAVAVYTYIKYHGDDAHDLKGKPNPPQSLVDACASVLGEALYYDNNFCLTMFCASSGGITANCYDVFSADLPYLRSVASEFDSQYDPHWGTVTYFTVEEVRNRLQGAYGIQLSGDPNNWIQITEGNGGYVTQVSIDGQITVRGNDFRAVMGLKSPKFTYICNQSQPLEPVDPDGAAELETAETSETSETATAYSETEVETAPETYESVTEPQTDEVTATEYEAPSLEPTPEYVETEPPVVETEEPPLEAPPLEVPAPEEEDTEEEVPEMTAPAFENIVT